MSNSEAVCLKDVEEAAHKILPKKALDYYKSGAEQQSTLRDNNRAFQRYRLLPRVLNDVSSRDLRTSILGGRHRVSMPIGISPTAMQRMAHPDGELASARAAEAAGTVFIMSTISTCSIEEVAEAAPNAVKWFQLYIYKDREITKSLVHRAEAAGFTALVLTVDAPTFGRRLDDIRNDFTLPPHLNMANFAGMGEKKTGVNDQGLLPSVDVRVRDQTLQWKDIQWLKSITKLPIILKGILRPSDALKAVEAGVAGVFVSNHGARQLDTVPATIDALPAIVAAVGGRAEIYLDGGVTLGTDVLKALALGARMVFLGRPVIWGLVCGGQAGVERVLQILRTEFDMAMALAGINGVAKIQRDFVVLPKSVL